MKRRTGIWPQALIAVAAFVILLLFAIIIVRLTSGVIRADLGGDQSHDPMFAEEPESTATIPPGLGGVDEGDDRTWEDCSDGWETGDLVPVDKTAEELAEEAKAD